MMMRDSGGKPQIQPAACRPRAVEPKRPGCLVQEFCVDFVVFVVIVGAAVALVLLLLPLACALQISICFLLGYWVHLVGRLVESWI